MGYALTSYGYFISVSYLKKMRIFRVHQIFGKLVECWNVLTDGIKVKDS